MAWQPPDMMVNLDMGPGRQYQGPLAELVKLDPMDVVRELCEHPSRYAFFAACQAAAKGELASRYAERKAAESTAYNIIRESFEASASKVTEGRLAAQVDSDPDVVAARVAERRAQETLDMLGAVVDALRHKKDCLIEVARLNRASDGAPITIPVPASRPGPATAPEPPAAIPARRRTRG